MLGFLASMFGGSESQSHATSTPEEMQAPEFQALRPQFAGNLSNLMTNGPPQYGGPLTTPMTGAEGNTLNNLAGQIDPNNARNTYENDVMGGKYLNSNPFLDAAIKAAQRPTLEGLATTVGRALPGRFTQAGQFTQANNAIDNNGNVAPGGGGGGSSAFDRAAAVATRGAANAVGDIATNMSFGNYANERGSQNQIAGLNQQEVQTTIAGLQAQALPRLIQEQGIQRGIQLFQTNIQAVLDTLKTIAGVTAPVIANKSESTSSSESQKGIFSSIGLPGIKFPT